MLIGEPGTGKTTLICSLLADHYSNVAAAYLNHPKMPFNDLLRVILRQFGIEHAPSSKLESMDLLCNQFRRWDRDQRVAVVVDEAQQIDCDTFEELRLLANYVAAANRQIQLILLGQPGLLTLLQSEHLTQFNDRIGTRAVLSPLEPPEVLAYIEHRLRACNGSSDKIFTNSALRRIVSNSGGIPRRVNVLCHNAMLASYSANSRKVTDREARTVIGEYRNVMSQRHYFPVPLRDRMSSESVWYYARPFAALILLVLLGMGLARLWMVTQPASGGGESFHPDETVSPAQPDPYNGDSGANERRYQSPQVNLSILLNYSDRSQTY